MKRQNNNFYMGGHKEATVFHRLLGKICCILASHPIFELFYVEYYSVSSKTDERLNTSRSRFVIAF
jgi:hypothetical protein